MAREGLTVNVSVTDTSLFSEMIGVLNDLLNDDRIEVAVKKDYDDRIVAVVENSGYYLERK